LTIEKINSLIYFRNFASRKHPLAQKINYFITIIKKLNNEKQLWEKPFTAIDDTGLAAPRNRDTGTKATSK
jgi:hypothetical protein